MFIDNHFGLKDLIATTSSVMFPCDPDKPYTPVALSDLAKVAGAILSAPELHKDKIYHIASDRFSLGELAKVSTLWSSICNEGFSIFGQGFHIFWHINWHTNSYVNESRQGLYMEYAKIIETSARSAKTPISHTTLLDTY